MPLPAGPRHPLEIAEALALVVEADARAAILVEGWSDEAAVEALARQRGLALPRERVVVLPIGGVTNLGKFAAALRAHLPELALCGLYDASEEPLALRALERAGVLAGATRAQAEAAGFFACEDDLEDELIRAVGPEQVERIVTREDELAPLRRFQAQPEHRGRELRAQLKRFLGTRAGRKIRYGALLIDALEPRERAAAATRVAGSHADLSGPAFDLQDSGGPTQGDHDRQRLARHAGQVMRQVLAPGIDERLVRALVAAAAAGAAAQFILQVLERGTAFVHGTDDVTVGNAMADADDHGMWMGRRETTANTHSVMRIVRIRNLTDGRAVARLALPARR